MSTKFVEAVAGRDYTTRDNGTMIVANSLIDPFASWRPMAIPKTLHKVDHSPRYGKKEGLERLLEEEHKLRRLTYDHFVKSDYSLMIGMAGYDASGKSGAINRLWEGIGKNGKVFQSVSYGKPDPVELRYPHYKRFFDHERFPQRGQIRALDRFWYERLMVERVEKLAPVEDLQRSYTELNMLEWLLVQNKVILVKIWMDISRQEQDKRFKDRAADASEKLSEEDFKAQKKRHLYKAYANEMFHRNGTPFAPWTIISAEDKRYSRVTVLETINAELRRVLGV
jgi:AMP-polyphosphate phosphotransferase